MRQDGTASGSVSGEFDPRLIFWVGLPALCFAFLVGAVLLANSASFTYRHWQMPDEKFTYTRDGRVVAPLIHDPEMFTEGTARAVTPVVQHHFEVMNPLSTASHEFVVRNEGDAPLLLRTGPTTCKCTVAKLGSYRVAPGEEGRVKLVWNTGSKETKYTQTATVYTNDPQRREITFRIFGSVQVRLVPLPAEVVFANLAPDQQETRSVNILTRHWERLEVVSATSTLDDLEWTIGEAEQDLIETHEASDVLRLEIQSPTGPADSPRFAGTLQVHLNAYASADAEPVQEVVEIPIRGSRLGRLGIYGADVNSLGQIDLGKVQRGESRTSRLVIRVRDQLADLNIQAVEVTPSFVQAEFSSSDSRPGTHFIDLTIPEDAPDHVGQTGKVRIVVDHPRIESPELSLDFTVMDYRRQ